MCMVIWRSEDSFWELVLFLLLWVPGIKLKLSLVAGDCLLIDLTSSGRFNAIPCHILSDICLGFDGI